MLTAIESKGTSPGVYVTERVHTPTNTVTLNASTGALVGHTRKGPVGTPTRITNEKELVSVFGVPAQLSYLHIAAKYFLLESDSLWITRVVNSAKTAGAYLMVDDYASPNPYMELYPFENGGGAVNPLETLGFTNQPGIENLIGFFCASNPGEWNNDLAIRIRPKLRVGATVPEDSSLFHVDVLRSAKLVESWLVSLAYRQDASGNQLNIEEVINKGNRRSSLIRFKPNPFVGTIAFTGVAYGEFRGGDSGLPVTDGLVMDAWDLMANKDIYDVNVLMSAGYNSPAVQSKMDQICRARGDCTAILDVPSHLQGEQDAVTYRQQSGIDSAFSALYTPDVLVLDQYSGMEILVPPSCVVGAVYAYNDQQAGKWYGPAGIVRGLVAAKDVRRRYGQPARDMLSENQINCLRYIPSTDRNGYGVVVWGIDTLQVEQSLLSNVPDRRILNWIESESERLLNGLVFDMADSTLWNQIEQRLKFLLGRLYSAGGLNAYLVQCDSKNNTEERTQGGDVSIYMELEPHPMAKRILLGVNITKNGVEFNENAR